MRFAAPLLAFALALPSLAHALPDCSKGPASGCTCPRRDASGPGSLPAGDRCFPEFHGEIAALTAEEQQHLHGASYHDGCPVKPSGLEKVTVSFWDFESRIETGTIIVAREHASAIVKAFRALYDARFPLARLEPVDAFGGDDDRAMEADDTSAFNCRPVPGTKTTSQHAYGAAIDLNPVENPFVRRDEVKPAAGKRFLDRHVAPGVIVADGPAWRAFRAIGWKWGGEWHSLKDWQHFSANGK